MSHSATFPPTTAAAAPGTSSSGGAAGRLSSSGGATLHGSGSSSGLQGSTAVRGGIKNAEGPLQGAANGLLASVHQAVQHQGCTASTQTAPGAPHHDGGGGGFPSLGLSSLTTMRQPMAAFGGSRYGAAGSNNAPVDEETLEMFSQEMSFSALYMHELHRRRINNPYYDNYEDLHARAMWEGPTTMTSPEHVTSPVRSSPLSPPPPTTTTPIQEASPEEEQGEDTNKPLLDFGRSSPKSS